MEILNNQKKILENQERILSQLSSSSSSNNPWQPNAKNTEDVLWTTHEVDDATSQEARMERVRVQRCKTGCAASMRAEGVTDLSMFYDKCVLDGGDVLLSTSTAETPMTTGAAALVAEYAKALETGSKPLVRCSVPVTDDDETCNTWNPTISRCM